MLFTVHSLPLQIHTIFMLDLASSSPNYEITAILFNNKYIGYVKTGQK